MWTAKGAFEGLVAGGWWRGRPNALWSIFRRAARERPSVRQFQQPSRRDNYDVSGCDQWVHYLILVIGRDKSRAVT